MRKSRFSTEQIAQILAHAEGGVSPGNCAGRTGGSEATFYVWRRKYGGLAPSEVRRLK
jgi:putative transposase